MCECVQCVCEFGQCACECVQCVCECVQCVCECVCEFVQWDGMHVVSSSGRRMRAENMFLWSVYLGRH